MKQEQKTHVSADALIQLLKGARSIRWQLALGVVMSLVLVVCALVIPTQMGALVQILIDYFDAPETGASVLAQLAPGLLALLGVFIVLCGLVGVKITKDKMYEAAVEDYNLAVYNHETYGNEILVPKPEDRKISMDDLTSDRWGLWTTILENLTWNGHQDSVIWEWVAKDGAGDRHFNAHNAFFGVTYNNGFIAGLLLVAYTVLAFIRAAKYYWAHRKASPYAATPLAFCTVFILVGMFESVYAPFSVIGCVYFLVQAPLWRAE